MLVIFSSDYGGPEIPDRTDAKLIARIQAGELPGLGLAEVGNDYHVVEHDGKETVYEGPWPKAAKVILQSEGSSSISEYLKMCEAIRGE